MRLLSKFNHHMSYREFSVYERSERVRRIDFAMRNFDPRNYLRLLFEAEQVVSDESKEIIHKKVTIPSSLTRILNAALLIRRHYTQWKRWLKDPSKKAPKPFESFSGDKLLIFYIYMNDIMKVFHLDPCYPFFVCEQQDANCYVIYGQEDDNIDVITSVVNTWKSMGSPWSASEFGRKLSSLAWLIKEPNLRCGTRALTIGEVFWKLTRQYGLYSVLYGYYGSTEKVIFQMISFVIEISTAVAFDKEVNTLEVVRELFPQFPELIPNVVKLYYRSIMSPCQPTHDYLDHTDRKSKWYENKLKEYSIADDFLTDLFDAPVSYTNINGNTPLLNQSILLMIKEHPELFTRWATDLTMRKLYRKLIDPVSLFD